MKQYKIKQTFMVTANTQEEANQIVAASGTAKNPISKPNEEVSSKAKELGKLLGIRFKDTGTGKMYSNFNGVTIQIKPKSGVTVFHEQLEMLRVLPIKAFPLGGDSAKVVAKVKEYAKNAEKYEKVKKAIKEDTLAFVGKLMTKHGELLTKAQIIDIVKDYV